MYDYQFADDAFAVWVLIHQTWRAMRKSEERLLAKTGLTPEKNELLWVASDHPSPLIPAQISRALFRESQTVAGLLTRMEREGLVTRVPQRKGRPFTEVKMTAKGQELRNQAKESDLAHISKIMSCLSAEEVKQLTQLLRKIRQNALDELRIELLPPPSWTHT